MVGWNCGCGDVAKVLEILEMGGCCCCSLLAALVDTGLMDVVLLMDRVNAVGSLKVATTDIFICG